MGDVPGLFRNAQRHHKGPDRERGTQESERQYDTEAEVHFADGAGPDASESCWMLGKEQILPDAPKRNVALPTPCS